MTVNSSPEPSKGLTPAERAQVVYFVRFVGTVLLFVLLASTIVGVLVMAFTNGG